MSVLAATIEKDLQSKIKEHLPAAVGEELQKVLEKAKSDEAELERCKKASTEDDKELFKRKMQIEELSKKLSLHVELSVRENAIKKREDNIEMEVLRLKLEFAEARLKTVEGLVQTVFKNPQKVTTIDETGSYPVASGGPNSYATTVSANKKTIISEDEV